MLVLSAFRRASRRLNRVAGIALLLALIAGLITPTSAETPYVATVVVYPLTSSGNLGGTDIGGKFSTILAIRLGEAGSLRVKPFTPGTDRSGYLTAARAEGADYYVAGFLTPIGAEVTLVLQVVSTVSGTVAWSESALVKTFNDADAQATAIHQAILSREGRYVAALSAPTPSPSDGARPGGKPNEAEISLSGPRGRGRATTPPAPDSSSPSPSPSPPAAPAATAVPARPTPLVASVAAPRPPVPTPPRPAPTVPSPRASALATAPPPFGRGSAYAIYRSSLSDRSRSLATRFAPPGVALASVSIAGTATTLERTLAIDALTTALHAHLRSDASWSVGTASFAVVRQRAEALCLRHPGTGGIFAARLDIVAPGPGSAVVVELALSRSDCLGVVRGTTTVSELVTTTREAAILKAAREASAAVAKPGA